MTVQGGESRLRRPAGPERFQQLVAGHDLVRVQEEQRKQGALFGPRRREFLVAVDDLKRSENPELHLTPILARFNARFEPALSRVSTVLEAR